MGLLIFHTILYIVVFQYVVWSPPTNTNEKLETFVTCAPVMIYLTLYSLTIYANTYTTYSLISFFCNGLVLFTILGDIKECLK